MAHRLSRGEKEKWIQDRQKQVKRPPVIIPASNNNALIEEHELTLIGRKGSRNLNWAPSENFAASTRWKNEEHKDSSWRSETNPPYDYDIRRDPHRRHGSSQTNRDQLGRPSARER
uniref:Uncharacterized protein n=1 Tax=Brassica oleracea TaxID=3712 RepID=A0A3P6FCR0_BRAOL|nr:unnamed protein product [Brassica oleracea]